MAIRAWTKVSGRITGSPGLTHFIVQWVCGANSAIHICCPICARFCDRKSINKLFFHDFFGENYPVSHHEIHTNLFPTSSQLVKLRGKFLSGKWPQKFRGQRIFRRSENIMHQCQCRTNTGGGRMKKLSMHINFSCLRLCCKIGKNHQLNRPLGV